MQFNPPLISNIEEVIPHIKDNPAFIVVDKGWYEVIDYVYNSRDTFNNDFARECRGIKFCSTTGRILARPYGKFHNLGECEGWRTEDVDLTKPHVVLDKLDGSMVHTMIRPETGAMHLMTRMGESLQALAAFAFLLGKATYGNGIIELAKSHPTKTFIFEYVGPNNRIVIPYEKEELIMTAIRDIYTGEYTTMGMMTALAAEYNIPVVQEYTGFADGYLPLHVACDDEKEGCVVRFDSGAMVKIKSEIYVRKHKSKELTETVKGVVQLLVDGTLDDVIPQLEESIVCRINDYERAFFDRLGQLHEGLRHILSGTKHMEQKEFALHIQATYPKVTQKLLFMTRKSGNGHDEIIKLIKARYNKESELTELLQELEFPVWQPFY